MHPDTKSKYDYLHILIATNANVFSPQSRKITLESGNLTLVENELKDRNIECERTAEGLVILNIGTSPFYYDLQNFVKNFSLVGLENDFGIINYKSGLYYDSDRKVFEDRFSRIVPKNDNALNNVNFLIIKEILTRDNIAAGSFANYFDTASRRIYVLSGTKGAMVMGYPLVNPEFGETFALGEVKRKLEKSFEAKGYIELFKSEAFDQVKDTDEFERIPELVRKLDLILQNTNRNFEIYMSNFSFEKLRDSLKQEKVKYYNLTRDVLSKLYGQVTAVPVAVAVSAFAGYKAEDMLVLSLILISYCFYFFFVLKLISVMKEENRTIESDFKFEKAVLIEKSTLTEQEITTEVGLIEKRLAKTKGLIEAFEVLVVALSSLYVMMVFYEMAIFLFHIPLWYAVVKLVSLSRWEFGL